MDSDLYDVLGIDSDATPEQVRKAYKKKALKTHPDRLPQGASASDKAQSEEQFRKVNNAYEILNDPQNRKLYDTHGVWPPPEPEEIPRRGRRFRDNHHPPFSDAFPDPFFTPFNPNPFNHTPHFTFTDPFTLFDSIFGDMHRHGMPHFSHHSYNDPHPHHEPPVFPWDRERHFREMNDFTDNSPPFPRGPSHMPPFPVIPNFGSSSMVYQSESVNFPRNSRWTQESRVTSTVNGVTQSIWKRRDSDGNEHITRTYPDGREQYTINGIEQNAPGTHADRYLTSGSRSNFPRVHHRHRSPPVDYSNSPSAFSSRGSPYGPGPAAHPIPDSGPDQKRKWWRGQW